MRGSIARGSSIPVISLSNQWASCSTSAVIMALVAIRRANKQIAAAASLPDLVRVADQITALNTSS